MADMSSYLKQQYAAQTERDLAELKSVYEKNLQTYTDAENQLPQKYEEARNSAAAQNAIARKNFNETAIRTGLNTGTTGQAELARSSVYQSQLGALDRAQANAQQELVQGKLTLQRDYENAIAKARAENEAALNNALYNEMLRNQTYSGGGGGGGNPVNESAGGGGGDGLYGTGPTGGDVDWSDTPMLDQDMWNLEQKLGQQFRYMGYNTAMNTLAANSPYLTEKQFDELAAMLEASARQQAAYR